jgi:AcrR family transcriptional regulator
MSQSTSSPEPTDEFTEDVISRTAWSSLARRRANSEAEVRRILDAGLGLMRGSGRSPTVSDIVTSARVSREAFYRYFRSKDDLVLAIMEAGARRFVGYLTHQMAKAGNPEEQVSLWVAGIMSQAGNSEVARTTRSVIRNQSRLADFPRVEATATRQAVADLVVRPLRELGSTDAARDAATICDAAMGRMEHFLWRQVEPSEQDIRHLADFCLRAVDPRRT